MSPLDSKEPIQESPQKDLDLFHKLAKLVMLPIMLSPKSNGEKAERE